MNRRWLNVLVLLALLFAAFTPLGVQPASASSEPGLRVLAMPQTAGLLSSNGATALAHYGAFSLWELPSGVGAPEGVMVVDPTIYLREVQINTNNADDAVKMPAALQAQAEPEIGFWMVQFAGPIQDAWLDGLKAQGLEIVAYIPENAYVVWGKQPKDSVLKAAAENPLLVWNGAYEPYYRLDPTLRTAAMAPDGEVDVTVQYYRTDQTTMAVESLLQKATVWYEGPYNVLNYTNIRVRLAEGDLAALAAQPDVFDIEIYVQPEMNDEVQNQILAGNITVSGGNTVPSSPGYLAWLATKGFPTTPSSYPIVDIVDDGLDQGNASNVLHPDFHELGVLANPDRVTYITNCTSDATGNGIAGHGNLNAGIVGGYNNTTGTPYEDANGYQLGLGISPYGRISGTKVFTNAGSWSVTKCGNDTQTMVRNSYTSGARITSNSWGAPNGGAYDTEAQLYDSLIRDASTTAGNQEMLHVFSAGNSGSSANTIGSPATAKNVLTVGATENVREQGTTDGCGVNYANNADDTATFSSRGPTDDGRIKPDITAPGTHVQGPASQASGYDGSGVCDQYHPSGQTLYAWSSGTSHSCPAISGVAQLVYEYYGRVLTSGAIPSPAMLKALIVNTPRYLTGVSNNDTLPSNNQGWGDANMGLIFDGSPRFLKDQTTTFGATGEAYTAYMLVSDTGKPVNISLVWSDAPGPTTGNAYVNNLDLEVTAAGTTYRGNVFSGSQSISGGTADARNNIENVFLPAGTSGVVRVRVIATNIAGDGLPANADTTDQDFALVGYNVTETTAPLVVLEKASQTWSDAVWGNNNGSLELGENFTVNVGLTNTGSGTATNVIGTLSVTGGDVSVIQASSAYADIASGGTQTNQTAYVLKVNSTHACATPIQLSLNVTYTGGSATIPLTALAAGSSTTSTYTYGGSAVAIPDNNPSGVQVPISITDSALIQDVNVKINATHTWDADLTFSLISPNSTTVSLINKRGTSGDNFTNTVLDDEAANPISGGTAPFTGSYRPESVLSVLDGANLNGTWNLKAVDSANLDTGSITGFELTIQRTVCTALGVGLSPIDNAGSGPANSPVNYTLTVTNTGSSSASFALTTSGNAWGTTISPSTVGPLTAGASQSVTVTVNIPAGQSNGSTDTVMVYATQTGSPTVRDAARVVTTVANATPVYGVTLTPATDAKSGNPGTDVSYTLTVTNTGNVSDSFTLGVSGAAWTTGVAPTTVGPLAAGATADVTVTVSIPAGAAGGATDAATITATSVGDGAVSDSSVLTTTANTGYGVTLTPATDAKSGNPGTDVSYMLTVTNTGNASDSFTLGASGATWTTGVAPTTVGPLAAGATANVTVTVSIPAGAAGGATDAATITATSVGNGAVSDSSVLTTTANTGYGVTLTPATDAKSGNPGTDVSYTLTVTNTGNASDSFTLGASGAAWTTGVAPTTVGPLAAGATADVTVTVSIPAGAAGGTTDAATITATSVGNGAVSDSSVLTTTANTGYGVTLTPATDAKSGNPGTDVSYTLTVTNTGNASDSFTLGASGAAWTTGVAPTTVGPLAAGATANVTVTVSIPAGAAGGATDAATITATSVGNGAISDSSVLTTTANTGYGVTLTPATDAKSGNPGTDVSYTLTVTNTGNVSDSFTLGASGAAWTTGVAPTTVGPLAAGATANVTVTVSIPAGAAGGATDAATITATSVGNGAVSDSSVLTTTANTGYGVTLTPATDAKSGNPGTDVSYTLIVTNTGNVSDSFTLGASGATWTTGVVPTTVGPLAAGATANVTVTVSIPAGAAGGAIDAATITATSVGNGAVSDSSVLTTTANTVRSLTLTPSTDAKSGVPGTEVSYTLTLTNTGNAADSFGVTTGGTEVWLTLINPATIGPLNAGESIDIVVTVSIPASASDGATDEASIIAASTGNPAITDSSVLTTTANVATVYGVSITPATDAKSGLVGTEVVYTLTVENTGNTSDSFDLTVGTATWSTVVLPTTIGPLAAGEAADVTVTVSIPAGAANGATDTAAITATSQGNTAISDSSMLTTTANIATVYGVSITPATDAKSGTPGAEVIYTLTVENTGNAADSFDLTADAVWGTIIAPSSVGPLAAGATTDITVTVSIPTGAANGAVDIATITATSQGNTAISDNSVLTTTAVIPHRFIYLPIILR